MVEKAHFFALSLSALSIPPLPSLLSTPPLTSEVEAHHCLQQHLHGQVDAENLPGIVEEGAIAVVYPPVIHAHVGDAQRELRGREGGKMKEHYKQGEIQLCLISLSESLSSKQSSAQLGSQTAQLAQEGARTALQTGTVLNESGQHLQWSSPLPPRCAVPYLRAALHCTALPCTALHCTTAFLRRKPPAGQS